MLDKAVLLKVSSVPDMTVPYLTILLKVSSESGGFQNNLHFLGKRNYQGKI